MKYSIVGPDVSFYQDDKDTPKTIDFKAMRDVGKARYVINRAGQNLWEDRIFDVSWTNSNGILPRGSYWFYDSRIDPKFQAKKWLSCFNDQGDLGELPHFSDFEDKYGGPFGTWKHWYDFMEELKVLRPGIRLGVYTGYFYWMERTVGVGIPTASLNYFKQYPLWVAAYNPVGPQVPKPWADWTLWQYTDNGDGTLYGVESKNIDLNYFNGDEEAFAKFAGSVPVVTPPEPAPTVDLVKSVRLTRRSGKVESLP